MSFKAAQEKFRGSRFWREYEPFSTHDLSSYLKVKKETGQAIIHAMREELSTHTVNGVKRHKRNSGFSQLIKAMPATHAPEQGKHSPMYY